MTNDSPSDRVHPAIFLVTVVPRVLHVLLSLLFIPLLYSFWGEDYSLYVTAFALVGFAQIIGEPLHLIYYELGELIKRNTVVLFLIAMLLFYSFILAPVIFGYGAFIGAEPLTIICFVFLPLFSAAQQFAKACLIYHNRASSTAIIETVGLLLKFPVGYFLIQAGLLPTVQSYLLYFCFISLWEAFITGVLVRSLASTASRKHQEISLNFLFGRLCTFGQLAMLTTLVSLLGNMDRLWIAKTEHPENLIKYSFALSVAALFHIVPGQIGMVYQPVYFRIKNANGQVALLFRQLRDITFFSGLLFVAFLVAGHHLLDFWLGRVLPAGDIDEIMSLALILILAVVLNMLFMPVQQIMIARSRQTFILAIQFATTLLMLGGLLYATQSSALLIFAIVVSLAFGTRLLAGIFVFVFWIRGH